MAKFGIIKSGAKQYVVRENEELIVDKLASNANDEIELDTLGVFEDDGAALELGAPFLKSPIKATVVEHVRGNKVRVARFKAKVRRRKVNGFTAELTKIKIAKI
ncbi:MAG: ribosomal protein [Candidatus Parcubacteria bacterium]|jgi:large subunit ribosomal protein L21